MAWRRLTSMRTALILLFLLALAAVPGSLLPQESLNPTKVSAYIKSHGAWGRFLGHIGAYDVFGSVWFAAIYLLLFVSLIGCLIPRIRVHVRALRRRPLAAPRNLDRLPENGSFETSASPEEYSAAARQVFGRRWRVERREEPSGALTLSAEKGYSRETGNILFHVALLAGLILIAVGRFYSYQGSIIVTQGTGFCNTVSQYDSWKPGRLAAEGKVRPAPFCLTLNKFTATYTSENEAKNFAAAVTYQSDATSTVDHHDTIKVNHPLRLEGDRVYLIGHGFTPVLTVHMPDGTVRTDTPNYVPEDPTTYLSQGVSKLQASKGANNDIGISGIFAPTAEDQGNGLITSISPRPSKPELSIFVYQGNLNYTGIPVSVYTLDTSKMHKIGAANLVPGQTVHLKNGVSVRFDGWKPWASIQVSHDPTQGYLLIVAVAMVVGLFGSLAVRRRRLWVRITPSGAGTAGSPTVVSVGGLARSDTGNFTAEFAALLERLTAAAPAAPAVELPVDDTVGAGRE